MNSSETIASQVQRENSTTKIIKTKSTIKTIEQSEIRSELTVETPEQHNWRCCSVFVVYF